MATILPDLNGVIDWLLRTSFAAAIVAILVLGMNVLLRRWIGASARYALLLLVAARLLMPAAPQSRWSIFNLLGSRPAPAKTSVVADQPPTGDWVINKEPLSQPIGLSPLSMQIESSARAVSWQAFAAAIWIAGVVFVALRISYANIKLSRRLRGAKLLAQEHLLQLLQSCKSQMKISRSLSVLETDAIGSPALMGLFRPRLLLPIGLCDRLSATEMRFVFLHELAHLKRHDIAIDWLLAILQGVHWFNPFIYLAFARARAERELARDAMVLRLAQPQEEISYGQTILKLIENFGRLERRAGMIGILEGNAGKRQLKRRITMIADFKRSNTLGAKVGLALALVLIGFALTDKKAAATVEGKPGNADKGGPGKSDENNPNPVAKPASAQHDANWPALDDNAKRDAAIQAILDRRIPEIRFQSVSFNDALAFLHDVSGANIYVNWKSLKEAGIEETTAITVRIRDVRVSKALAMILAELGNQVGFEVEDGGIVIDTREQLDKNTVVAVYDIRDLLVGAGDEKQTEALAKQISSVIEEMVDKNMWEGNGGPIPGIKHLKGQLIVTQTKGNQKRVALLLDKLREAHSIQVSVQLTLMSMPRALLKDLEIDIAKDPGDIKGGAVVPGKNADKARKTFQATFLDEDQVIKLTRAVQASADATNLTAPRIMLFSGQQGSVAVGSDIPYISGWSELKNGKRDSQISYARTGFTMTLQPTVSADRKYLTINMQPRLSQLRKIDDMPWPQAGALEKLNVQKPDLAVQEFDEMVSIPDNRTLLTVLQQEHLEKEKDAKAAITVLLVRPSIIIPREIEHKELPDKPKL